MSRRRGSEDIQYLQVTFLSHGPVLPDKVRALAEYLHVPPRALHNNLLGYNSHSSRWGHCQFLHMASLAPLPVPSTGYRVGIAMLPISRMTNYHARLSTLCDDIMAGRPTEARNTVLRGAETLIRAMKAGCNREAGQPENAQRDLYIHSEPGLCLARYDLTAT